MKHTNTPDRIISLILVLSVVSTLVLMASAESSPISLPIHCNDAIYNLDVIKFDGKWFADISSLSDVGNCEYSVNKDNHTVFLYKTQPFVILYSTDQDLCYFRGDSCFVPLEEASVAAGISFYGNDPVHATVYRTPKQMLAEFDYIYFDERYQITQLLLTDGYWLAAWAARTYAIMPFVGSGSLIGAISGADEAERYRIAFASILTNDGNTTDLISSMADISGDVHKNAKTLRAVQDLTKKDGKMYNFFLSKGASPNFLNSLAYERDPYDSLDNWFEDCSSVLSAINYEHFLDLCTFYAVSVDTEESILVAMKRVFENSSNEESRRAVEKLIDAHYGEGYIAITDIYGGMVWDVSMEYINGKAETLFYGGYSAGASLAARGIDTIFQASDMSEAYLFFPIYSSIQQDLYDYYYTHRDDVQDNTLYDLRAVTIMYLKAAIAAYEYASFDDSLADTLETAISTLNDELANVMSYSEIEYKPNYSNRAFVEWLDKLYGPESAPERPIPSDPPLSSYDLFNGTYWRMSFGQSLGYSYIAKFSPDGSFIAKGMGSGAYTNGTYTYSGGKLEIVFDIGGFGYPSAISFSGDANGFTSLERYPMQAGEDYYYITPDSSASESFNQATAPEVSGQWNVPAELIGKWVCYYDFGGIHYASGMELRADGSTVIYDAEVNGHVWYWADGSWTLSSCSNGRYVVELHVSGGDAWQPAATEAYCVTIAMKLNGNEAYIEKQGGEYPHLAYNYVFYREALPASNE